MEKKFLNLLKEALEIEDQDITMDQTLRDFDEWDSLAQLSLIAALDEEFGVAIEDEDFQKLQTVGDLFKVVQEQAS